MAQAMPSVRTARTAALAAHELAQIRALLDEVFPGDFTEDDWQHALGGIHALAYEGSELVGHGSVVMRILEHDGLPMPTGYVEAMGVRKDRRRRGYGAALMAALEEHIHIRYQLGALAATDEARAFYAARGWIRWIGPTEPDGEGAVYVFPLTAPVDPWGTLRADRREGDIW
jgi:aminoglycoside 2'-N-acetyltransferase I